MKEAIRRLHVLELIPTGDPRALRSIKPFVSRPFSKTGPDRFEAASRPGRDQRKANAATIPRDRFGKSSGGRPAARRSRRRAACLIRQGRPIEFLSPNPVLYVFGRGRNSSYCPRDLRYPPRFLRKYADLINENPCPCRRHRWWCGRHVDPLSPGQGRRQRHAADREERTDQRLDLARRRQHPDLCQQPGRHACGKLCLAALQGSGTGRRRPDHLSPYRSLLDRPNPGKGRLLPPPRRYCRYAWL